MYNGVGAIRWVAPFLTPRNCIYNSDPFIKGGLVGGSLSPLNKGGCPKDGGILAWMPAPSLASGIYLVRAKIGGNDKGLKPLVTKRIVYLK